MDQRKVWERPKSVSVPTVWSTYESKKPMPNGKKPKFRIQDFSEEWRDQVIENMKSFFLRDEPLSKSLCYLENSDDVEFFLKFVHEFLDRKMVLIAVVENLNELDNPDLPALAGCNITTVTSKYEKDEDGPSVNTRIIFDALNHIKKLNDPYEYYKVSEFLYAMGLSVNPAFRGHNLGYEILKARIPLCKAVGIKATVTVFTSTPSQIAADKIGFELLAEVVYDEYKDKDGKIIFNVDGTKSMKLMGLRIE